MYSYGSGLAASLWSVVGRRVEGKFALSNVSSQVRYTLRYMRHARRYTFEQVLCHTPQGAGCRKAW